MDGPVLLHGRLAQRWLGLDALRCAFWNGATKHRRRRPRQRCQSLFTRRKRPKVPGEVEDQDVVGRRRQQNRSVDHPALRACVDPDQRRCSDVRKPLDSVFD